MRIKHYTLLFAFLAIFMGMPLMQGCSDPFDEHGGRGTEIATKDGWGSVTMSVEGLGLRNPLTPLPYAGGRERDGGGEDQGTCV